MAMRFSLFKTPKHRVFEYEPMYVDEKKERKEELERLVEEARSGEYNVRNSGTRIRQGLRTGGIEFKSRLRKESLSQKVRFITIVAFLAFLLYVTYVYS